MVRDAPAALLTMRLGLLRKYESHFCIGRAANFSFSVLSNQSSSRPKLSRIALPNHCSIAIVVGIRRARQ